MGILKGFFQKRLEDRKFEIKQEKRIEVGNYIRKERTKKALSLSELSELTEIKLSSMFAIECGAKLNTTPFHLKKIAKVLNTDYMELYKMVGYLD